MRNNRPHKGLKVWQQSVDLVVNIYKATETFPRDQVYVLSAQMQRAAISVPSNIAEGMAKSGNKDRRRFLEIAQGSLSELDTQVEIALRLGFLVPLPLLKFVWERALVHVSNALIQVECKVNFWKRH